MRRMLIIGMFALLAIMGMACGRAASTPGIVDRPDSHPPARIETCRAKSTVASAPEATKALTELEISVNGDALEFDQDSFEVSSGIEVVLVFDNVSGINQHNWVLVKPGTKDDVVARGTQCPDNGWLQPDDPDVIAHTKLLDPGDTGEARFTAPAAGTYQFVCTFPGHSLTMYGDFVVTP